VRATWPCTPRAPARRRPGAATATGSASPCRQRKPKSALPGPERYAPIGGEPYGSGRTGPGVIAMQQERPWLAQYPGGVPAEINPDAYPSVVAVLQDAIQRFRDRPAYSSLVNGITYADLDVLRARIAAYLLGDLALKLGDRVAIMIPNCLQHQLATHGILRAGLTVDNVNPLYTARELEHQLAAT